MDDGSIEFTFYKIAIHVPHSQHDSCIALCMHISKCVPVNADWFLNISSTVIM